MRCFLAALPDADTRDRLAAIASRLHAWGMPARWVHPEDFHLTLVFLGEVSPEEVRHLPAAVDPVLDPLPVASLHLPGLGAMGGRNGPRVVYAGISDPTGWCRDRHLDLCSSLGVAEERAYRPHVTLCRPLPGQAFGPRTWTEALTAFGEALWGPFTVASVALCRSRPESRPRYQIIDRWEMRRSASA